MSNSFQMEHEIPEMESIATLAEHMVYRLPGCADIMIRKTLQLAFADFCRLSCCLTTTRFITMKTGVRHVHIHPKTPRMNIETICNVWLNDWIMRKGDYTVDGNVVELHPSVGFDDDSVLKVTAVEVPPFGSEEAPQWFINKYGQAIISGALVKLFGMANKPWSDPSQAQSELITYENFLTTARVNSVTEGTNNGDIDVVDTSNLL